MTVQEIIYEDEPSKINFHDHSIFLRPTEEKDIPDLLKLYSDPDVRQFILGNQVIDGVYESYIKECIYDGENILHWRFIISCNGTVLGEICYCFWGNRFEATACLFPQYRGNGIIQVAIHLLVRIFTERHGGELLYAVIDTNNVASLKAAKKYGADRVRTGIQQHSVKQLFVLNSPFSEVR